MLVLTRFAVRVLVFVRVVSANIKRVLVLVRAMIKRVLVLVRAMIISCGRPFAAVRCRLACAVTDSSRVKVVP